jgi:hypothetical protein
MLLQLFILHYAVVAVLFILSWLRVSNTSAVFAVITMVWLFILARNASYIEVVDQTGSVQAFSDITTMWISAALAVLQLVRFVTLAVSVPIQTFMRGVNYE